MNWSIKHSLQGQNYSQLQIFLNVHEIKLVHGKCYSRCRSVCKSGLCAGQTATSYHLYISIWGYRKGINSKSKYAPILGVFFKATATAEHSQLKRLGFMPDSQLMHYFPCDKLSYFLCQPNLFILHTLMLFQQLFLLLSSYSRCLS